MYTKSGAFRRSFGASPSLEIEGGGEYHLGWFLRGPHSKSNCFETSNQRVNLGPHKASITHSYKHRYVLRKYVYMHLLHVGMEYTGCIKADNLS